jgi:hypothetical protein
MPCAITDGCLQGAEIAMAFAGGDSSLSNIADLQRMAASASARSDKRLVQSLEAVAVELRLMQPGVASRNGLGCRGEAGADELRGHATATLRARCRLSRGAY